MTEEKRFYTALTSGRHSFQSAASMLTNAIKEAVFCDRVLLIPRIELSKAENFNVPSQSSAADYFDLPQTIVTRKEPIAPCSFIGESDQWPDMNEWSVANLGPGEPLDAGCSEQVVVRHLTKATKAFYSTHGAQHKPIKFKLWRHPNHKDIKVQLEPALLWREMADEVIDSLGGAGTYLFLELEDDRQKTIVPPIGRPNQTHLSLIHI